MPFKNIPESRRASFALNRREKTQIEILSSRRSSLPFPNSNSERGKENLRNSFSFFPRRNCISGKKPSEQRQSSETIARPTQILSGGVDARLIGSESLSFGGGKTSSKTFLYPRILLLASRVFSSILCRNSNRNQPPCELETIERFLGTASVSEERSIDSYFGASPNR
ncbi:hypothetical protein DLM78_11640 [Leptospira stimsonii]|uniref:Uncharacterized protein n=1 Tax=Leptospira stimsonii TaxID=2202203 RepID=A0A8B3CR15_9LEPT|nr:hypothetical protein DLM78_11640 [Leptospira stimsonii]